MGIKSFVLRRFGSDFMRLRMQVQFVVFSICSIPSLLPKNEWSN